MTAQIQPWWAQETSFKNIKNLVDSNLLIVRYMYVNTKLPEAQGILYHFQDD